MLVLVRLEQQMCSWLAVVSAGQMVKAPRLLTVGLVATVVLAVVVSLVLRSPLLLGRLFP